MASTSHKAMTFSKQQLKGLETGDAKKISVGGFEKVFDNFIHFLIKVMKRKTLRSLKFIIWLMAQLRRFLVNLTWAGYPAFTT